MNVLLNRLQTRKGAIGYLQAILEDYQIYKNPATIHRALRTVVEAQGGVSVLAKQIDMDPQVFSKMISNEDVPLIEALGIVLKALGYQLAIQPIKLENRSSDTYTGALERQNTSAHVAENEIDSQQ